MKEFPENNEEEAEFEVDFETLARLRQRAMNETRAQANVVDGDVVEQDED